MLVTKRGLQLNTEIIDSGHTLKFTRMAAGTGLDPGTDYTELTDLVSFYADMEGMAYSPPQLDPGGNGYSFSVLAHVDNTNLTTPIQITEVGIFAEDMDGNEILYGIDPRYDTPAQIWPPSLLPGFVSYAQATFTEYVEVNRDLKVDLTLVADGDVTWDAADGRYWIIGVKYPATEITETTGTTTEEWQRIQDDRIAQIITMLESGSTAGTIYERPTLYTMPPNWKILNNSGWRDLANGVIRA